MASDSPNPLVVALQRRVGTGGDSTRVALATIVLWRELDAVLNPVLGRGGVAAMYRRCLSLAARTHAWLPPPDASQTAAPDLEALQASLSGQDAATAAAAAAAFLHAFHDLLASLVGASLTGRLLGSVMDAPAGGGPSPQDAPA